jgi:hypothetical protein
VIAALTALFLGAALDRGGKLKPILAVFLSAIALASAGHRRDDHRLDARTIRLRSAGYIGCNV